MQFISVFHILAAMVLATVAAPVFSPALPAVTTVQTQGENPQPTEVFQTIDIPNGGLGISEEADPQPDTGCVIA
ncbi:hypothetical protein C8F04DRAFT_1119821 [Mycena alexandri]|uniref:Uncharacterized protein n=1 Tax=Mycena alexandri TaxID=1745969 RepID=A0AAD6WYR0_9AGAR|nr:hypothetical protein C8F04DRAFT_1119821 [Mycena alexandri]